MNKRGYKQMVLGVERSRISYLIDEYVHNERDREIMKLNLLNGVSYTRIADRIEPWISPRAIQEIMNRWMPVIKEHL